MSNQVSFSFAVPHPSAPLAKKRHFGHVGGADRDLAFVLQRTVPVTADRSQERKKRLSNVDMVTFRELMTDAAFTTDARIPLEKPAFFFGDHVGDGGYSMYDGDYKWLRQIGDRRFFLPDMERMYPLSYLQHMSVPRKMKWDVSRYVPEITLGDLGAKKVYRHDSHDRAVLGLFPGSLKTELPVGEIPKLGTTFLNAFMKAEGDFPVEFRSPGWVHSTEKYWWGRMVSFVLAHLGDLLEHMGLYPAVRAVQYGIQPSS